MSGGVPGTFTARSRESDGVPGTFVAGFCEPPIRELPLPGHVRALMGGHTKRYELGVCNVLIGREPAGANGEMLWHLSISTQHRHPTWDEIKLARYRLLPAELTFGMLLPPAADFVNVPEQDHVFHLWEITDPREPWSCG